jgi:hypothetical protein
VIQLTVNESLIVCGAAQIAFEVNVQRTFVLFDALLSIKVGPVPAAKLLTNHWYAGLLPPLVEVAEKFNVFDGHPE